MCIASHPETDVHESHRLPWDAQAPRAARAIVRKVLDGWACLDADGVYTVTLVVSELVTNVVQHAEDPSDQLELHLLMEAGRTLRVAVADGSAVEPVVRDLDDTATNGRGLQLVSTLVDRWGVERSTHGKSVWVELDLPSPD